MRATEIERLEISSPRLESMLDGTRILHLSDLHVCRRFRKKRNSLAHLIAQCPADLVVCTGDVVNDSRYWDEASQWLADLPLPPDIPRVGVPGNWDHRFGGSRSFRRNLEAAGFIPLINQGATLPVRGGQLQVAGFDDLRLGRFRPEEALADLDPRRFVLALCHTPDQILHVDRHRFDLMLCGHTHGGQIRFPKWGATITSTLVGRAYAGGLFSLGSHRYLYVSRGIGEGRIPWRFLCPPELALLTLKSILAPA